MKSVTLSAWQFIFIVMSGSVNSYIVATNVNGSIRDAAIEREWAATIDSLLAVRLAPLEGRIIELPDHTEALTDLQASVALIPVDALPCPQCPEPAIIPEAFDYLPVLESIGGTVYRLSDRIRSLEMTVAIPDTFHFTLTREGDSYRIHTEPHAVRWELR